MAPYWTAESVDTIAANTNITILERDYEYLYISYSNDSKRGYIPRSATSATGYSWCNHDIFIPGYNKTTSSITVRYAPTSSSSSCGSIDADEGEHPNKPLLVLREEDGFYFIQYTTNTSAEGYTNPLCKRGWVLKTSINISNRVAAPIPDTNTTPQYVLIRNNSNKCLTAVSSSSEQSGYKVTFQNPAQNNASQIWKLHKLVYSGSVYYKLQSYSCGLYLQIEDSIPIVGDRLILATGATPHKAQEFSFEQIDINYDTDYNGYDYDYGVRILTRCSGDFLALHHSGANYDVIQYRNGTNQTHQFFDIDPIDNHFLNKYANGKTSLTYGIYPNLLVGNINTANVTNSTEKWNNVADVSLNKTVYYESADVRLMGDYKNVYNIKLDGLYGLTCAVPDISDIPTENPIYDDRVWYGSVVYLNTTSGSSGCVLNLSQSQINKTITHEVGHALKLRHPHETYINGSYTTVSVIYSIMNQGYVNLIPSDLTTYDRVSLSLKW